MRNCRRRRTGLLLLPGLAIMAALCTVTLAVGREQGRWETSSALAAREFISNRITAFATGDSDALWVGTDNGLVWTKNDGRDWTYVNLAEAQPAYGKYRYGSNNASGEDSQRQDLTGVALERRNTITCMTSGRRGLWVGTLNGLCLADRGDPDEKIWYVYPPEDGVPGPEIWSIVEHNGIVWVSARGGIFRSTNWGNDWVRVPGDLPERVDSIMVRNADRRQYSLLAGFDLPKQYASGADILRSSDSGKSWEKLHTKTAAAASRAAFARSHKLVAVGDNIWACTRYGLARSANNGNSWHRVRYRSGLAAREAFDLIDTGKRLWVATSDGLFFSKDDGATWTQDRLLHCPVRRLFYHNGQIWIGTDGGLMRRLRADYWVSFSVRTVVTSLVTTRKSGTEILWAGTEGGLAFSENAGISWRRYSVVNGLPSNRILCLAADGDRIWAGTDGGIWTAIGRGLSPRRYIRHHGINGQMVRDIFVTKTYIWAATNRGLSVLARTAKKWRTFGSSADWYAVCVVDEAIFGAVTRRNGQTSLIRFDPRNGVMTPLVLPGHGGARIHDILPVGKAIWVASDAGLYCSRDNGETWTGLGAESLWSRRITRMALGSEGVICVQATPADPPSPTAFLNISCDEGRSWSVLPAVVPGHATGLVMFGRERKHIAVGTRDGVSIYMNYKADLRGVRRGWLTWNRIAALSGSAFRADRLGAVSAVDPYAFHDPTLWLGSKGAGAIERGVPVLDSHFPLWSITGLVPINLVRNPTALFPGQEIHAIAAAPQSMLFGTSRGLLLYQRSGSWRSFIPRPGELGAAPVTAIAVRKDEAWLGTDRGISIFHLKTKQWRTFMAETSVLPDNRVTAIISDGENLWGGTHRGGFRVDALGRWQIVLPEEHIFDIAAGSAMEYFATDRGIFSLDRTGRVRRHIKKDNSEALVDDRVYRVFIDGPELWAATQDGIRKVLHDRAESEAVLLAISSLRGPAGVLVVINENSSDSIEVGNAYAAMRKIPPENICRIKCSTEETISWNVYEYQIRLPIWRHLQERGIARRISFIVTTRGIPLRISSGSSARRVEPSRRRDASIDSELMLLAWRYPLPGALLNPYLHREEPFDSGKFGMYLVTRLDGPSLQAALGLARRALKTEETSSFEGRGFARFDLYPKDQPVAERFNRAILQNYKEVRRQNRLSGRIALPERTRLPYFREGDCYNTFFYLGWGVKKYDSKVYSWVMGGIGVCLDPATATTLRDPAESWVASAIDGRITATIGMTHNAEPHAYLSVSNMYRYLKAGFTWAEAAYMCIPQLSWQAVVIGDPLYTPF